MHHRNRQIYLEPRLPAQCRVNKLDSLSCTGTSHSSGARASPRAPAKDGRNHSSSFRMGRPGDQRRSLHPVNGSVIRPFMAGAREDARAPDRNNGQAHLNGIELPAGVLPPATPMHRGRSKSDRCRINDPLANAALMRHPALKGHNSITQGCQDATLGYGIKENPPTGRRRHYRRMRQRLLNRASSPAIMSPTSPQFV